MCAFVVFVGAENGKVEKQGIRCVPASKTPIREKGEGPGGRSGVTVQADG